MLSRKLLLKIGLPLIILSLLFLNYFTLDKLEDRIQKIAASNDEITVDFITKNLLFNALEVQVSYQDTPIIIQLDLSYFRATADYRFRVSDITALLKAFPSIESYLDLDLDNLSGTDVTLEGTYHLTENYSTTNMHDIAIKSPNNTVLTAKKIEVSLLHQPDLSPTAIIGTKIKNLQYLDALSIDEFDFDSTSSNEEYLKYTSQSKDLSISKDTISQALNSIISKPTEIPTFFPISHDVDLSIDMGIIRFLEGTPQNIDSPLTANGHLLISSPLLITESRFSASVEPKGEIFYAALNASSKSSVTNHYNFDLMRALLAQLSQELGTDIPIDTSTPSQVTLDTKIGLALAADGKPLYAEGTFNELREYPNNINTYVNAEIFPVSISSAGKGIYLSVNGKFIEPKPTEKTLVFMTIKTNTIHDLAKTLPQLSKLSESISVSKEQGADYTIDIHLLAD